MLWGGVAAGLIGMLVLIIILNQPMDNPPQDPDEKTPTQLTDVKPKGPDNPATDPGENKPPSEPPESEGTQLVSDDGETLWQSPTSGDAVDLSWSPPAGQLFMVVQIADLLNTPVGPDVQQSLGPNFLQHLSDWESTTGFKLTEIRELVFSWSEQEGAFPSPTIVVRLIAQSTQEEILATLGNPVPEETEHGTVYQGSGWNFIVPDSPGLFVMGTKTALTDTLELDGSPPLIRRTLSQLVKQSDRDQHVTLLFAPSFLSTTLFRDGHAFYFGEASKVRQPLQWLLGDGLEAAMVSLHVGDVLYVEARLTAGLTFDKRELVTQLKERMGQLHDKIESHMVLLNPSIYWRALAFRFPLMVAYLHEQTRVQIEGDTPVLNIALPVQATSNLLLASELSIASEPGAVNVATTNGPQKPMNLMQVLEYPFSVDIPQQDLNLAIADIANEVRSTLRGLPFKFDIQIAGGDLMADGITRNQAIRDFLMKDKPLAEVLTGIVMKANPDPTVTSPTMPNQKLIWLITEDPDDPANKIILITTRKAAETNQYTLPAVFVE